MTGKAKYAEDYRADGMLFCKLLLSPMPHARVRSIDARAALAMPGVKAILTVDDLPAPADSITDMGTVIPANPLGERGAHQGAGVSGRADSGRVRGRRTDRRRSHRKNQNRSRAVAVRGRSAGQPAARRPERENGGNVWVRVPPPPAKPGERPPVTPPEVQDGQVDRSEDFADAKDGRLPMGKATERVDVGDVEAGLKNAALVLDETFVTPNTSHQCLETRTAMAYWQNGKVYVHSATQSTAQTVPAIARWLDIDPSDVVFISEYTGGGFGSKITGDITLVIPALLSKKTGAPVMMRISREEEHYIGRARPSLHGRMKVGFSKEGRITALDMFVICDNGPYDMVGDAFSSGPHRFAAVPAAGHALARRDGPDQHPAAHFAELARRNAGNRAHGAGPREGRAQARHRSGGASGASTPRRAKPRSGRSWRASSNMPPARSSRKRWTAAQSSSNGTNEK